MRGFCTGMISLLLAGAVPAAPAAAAALEDPPCATKSECDLRQEMIDMKNRRDAWNANVKREDDYAIQRAQLRAQARADANNGSISRSQQIMHRRHEAAAAAANHN